MSETLTPPQQEVGFDLLNDLPEETQKNLSETWKIPKGMDAKRMNSSKENQIQLLLQKISINLESDNPQLKAEAGRVLSHVRQELDKLKLKMDKGQTEDRANIVGRLKSKTDLYWLDGGEEANKLFMEQLQEKRESIKQINGKKTGKEIDQEKSKYPELAKEALEEMKKLVKEQSVINFKIEILIIYINRIEEVCSKKSGEILKFITLAEQGGLISEKRTGGIKLCSDMLKRIATSNPTFTELKNRIDKENFATPVLDRIDIKYLDNLDKIEAEKYIKAIVENNNNKIKDFNKLKESLIKDSKPIFKKLANVGAELNGTLRYVEEEESHVVKSLADNFDQTLSRVFNINKVPVEVGKKIDDYEDAELLNNVEEGNDLSLDDTVAKVTREGYRLDPDLSQDSKGDIILIPQIKVYKYKK